MLPKQSGGPVEAAQRLAPSEITRANWPGEMRELVDSARLEIVCEVKSFTGGSNPSLSATQPRKASEVQ